MSTCEFYALLINIASHPTVGRNKKTTWFFFRITATSFNFIINKRKKREKLNS